MIRSGLNLTLLDFHRRLLHSEVSSNKHTKDTNLFTNEIFMHLTSPNNNNPIQSTPNWVWPPPEPQGPRGGLLHILVLHIYSKQAFMKHAWPPPKKTFKHFILVKIIHMHSWVFPMQCSSLGANTEKQSLHLKNSCVLQRRANTSAVVQRSAPPRQLCEGAEPAADVLHTSGEPADYMQKYNNENKPHVSLRIAMCQTLTREN